MSQFQIKNWLGQKTHEVFGCDLRSLAFFRVCMALLIIVDILWRWQDIGVFYTDQGVLPRSTLLQYIAHPFFFSAHLISGHIVGQNILFALTIVIALCMLVGYRTSWAVFLSWFMMVSLHNRNPLILYNGDVLMRISLFWAMFLPLGAKFSFDEAFRTHSKKIKNQFLSPGTVAIVIQMVIVYFFTAAWKHGTDWKEGTAIYYALNLDAIVTGFGKWLLGYPELLKVSTHIVLFLEWLAPALLLCPFFFVPARYLGILMVIGLQISFRLGMNLHLFTFIGMISIFPLIPSSFWDYWLTRLRGNKKEGLRIYFNGSLPRSQSFCYLLRTFALRSDTAIFDFENFERTMEVEKAPFIACMEGKNGVLYENEAAVAIILQYSPLKKVLAPLLKTHLVKNFILLMASSRRKRKVPQKVVPRRAYTLGWMSWRGVFPIFFLIYVLIFNFVFFDKKGGEFLKPYRWMGYGIALRQQWSMFAPKVTRSDKWFIAVGHLKDGRKVDLFNHPKPISWKLPTEFSRVNWFKYNKAIVRKEKTYKKKGQLRSLAKYSCREWNKNHFHDERVESLEIYSMREVTQPDYQPSKIIKKRLWRQNC